MMLTSCFQGEIEYTGDNPELFSVAMGSVLGATGTELDERGRLVAASVVTLEEDRFGRVLFRYSEEVIYREVDSDSGRLIWRRVHVYVVAQKVDVEYAYFYPHYNFIIRGDSGTVNRRFESYFEDIPSSSFEDMVALREANSWNQEMSDDSAFERVKIVRQKESGPITNRMLVDVRREIIDSGHDSFEPGWGIFLRTDRYGRSIYTRTSDDSHLVVLFQPDHSFNVETGVLEITDMFNYQTELRLFMEANGWNTPWVEP